MPFERIGIDRRRVVAVNSGISRTKGSEEPQSNINRIVEKYRRDGQVPDWNRRPGRYGDFSSGAEYLEVASRVRQAQESFDALPPNIRSHFKNDPGELLAAVHDPARADECRALGLLRPGEAPREVPASAGSPPAESGQG